MRRETRMSIDTPVGMCHEVLTWTLRLPSRVTPSRRSLIVSAVPAPAHSESADRKVAYERIRVRRVRSACVVWKVSSEALPSKESKTSRRSRWPL